MCDVYGITTQGKFVKNPMNVLDACAIMPFYIEALAAGADVKALRVLRSARLIRLFRLLRLKPLLRARIDDHRHRQAASDRKPQPISTKLGRVASLRWPGRPGRRRVPRGLHRRRCRRSLRLRSLGLPPPGLEYSPGYCRESRERKRVAPRPWRCGQPAGCRRRTAYTRRVNVASHPHRTCVPPG